jgi:hypothetical protein
MAETVVFNLACASRREQQSKALKPQGSETNEVTRKMALPKIHYIFAI